MRRVTWKRIVSLATIVLLTGLFAAVEAGKVDKAMVIVKNKATSNGEIVFKLTPDSGEPIEIKVGIVEKMKAEEIAEDIKKELILALGEAYEVKAKAADKISIAPADKATTFDLVISSQTVTGLSVVIK